MIKYNWTKINNWFNWSTVKVCKYFYMNQNLPIPSFCSIKLFDKNLYRPYPKGHSYIINIDDALLNINNLTDLYIYLQIASKRNLFDYNIRNISCLNKYLLNSYEYSWATESPLVKIENDNIYLKYEQEKQYEY